MGAYLVNPLRDVQRWRPDLLVDGLRRDVLGRVAATLEVLDHVLRRRVERVGKTRLDGVEALVGEVVGAGEDGCETLLDGLGVGEGLLRALRGSEVRRMGVGVAEEGAVDGAEGLRDEGDGADAREDGELGRALGGGLLGLRLRGHCWQRVGESDGRAGDGGRGRESWNCDKVRGRDRRRVYEASRRACDKLQSAMR